MHHRRDALYARLFFSYTSPTRYKEIPVPWMLPRTEIPEERANNLIITKTCSRSLPAKYIFSSNEWRAGPKSHVQDLYRCNIFPTRNPIRGELPENEILSCRLCLPRGF